MAKKSCRVQWVCFGFDIPINEHYLAALSCSSSYSWIFLEGWPEYQVQLSWEKMATRRTAKCQVWLKSILVTVLMLLSNQTQNLKVAYWAKWLRFCDKVGGSFWGASWVYLAFVFPSFPYSFSSLSTTCNIFIKIFRLHRFCFLEK